MPLILSPESIGTLQDEMYMDGNAIPILLGHYNPQENISILPTVSNIEQLNAQLRHAHGDEDHNIHLIALNVNTIRKNLGAGNNHYVGLMIDDRDNTILYIDPMGHPMSNEVRQQLDANFAGYTISTYDKRLQYADIIRPGEEAAEAIGNATDCGPMLTYLLTRAAHGQELPTSRNLEESKNIGRGLRRQFIQDLGKEAYNHHTNSSANLSLLNPEDLTISDAPKRRLDSLARVITGDDICTAVIFDGQNIRIANNNNHQSELIREGIALCSYVAQKKYNLEAIASDSDLQLGRDAVIQRGVKKAAKKLKPKRDFATSKKYSLLEEHQERSITDLTKVICSLAEDSDPTKRFPDEFKSALIEGRVQFLRSTLDEHGKHAEMIILDSVIKDRKINVTNEKIGSGKEPLYVGLTKLCCLDCHDAITAFNAVSRKFQIVECSIDPIETRGTHLGQYDGWITPNFVQNDPAVLQKFNEIQSARETLLINRTKEIAPRSPSPPETSRFTASLDSTSASSAESKEDPPHDQPSESMHKRIRRDQVPNTFIAESDSSSIGPPNITPQVNYNLRGGRASNRGSRVSYRGGRAGDHRGGRSNKKW